MADETFDYPTMARADPRRQGHRRAKDPRGARPRPRSEGAHLQGSHPGDGRRRREVPPERVLRAAGSPVRTRHVRRARPAQAAHHGLGPERRLLRRGRHRHRPGRPPRHRQEPGRDDARGRGVQGRQPRPRRGAGGLRARGRGARCDHRRDLGPHDDHHARDEADDRRAGPGGAPRAGEGDGGRRAGEPGDRRRDRGGRQREGLAREVAPRGTYIAGSIGPTSRLPRDYALDEGVTDEEYVATFREQAEALAEGGVDLFAVETMMFPQEATAAVRACKQVANLPVMATMFFQYEEMHDRDRTMWGESPAEVATSLLAAGADVVGMNCGRGPDRAIVIIREMRKATDAPLVAYPNAGLPITTGDTVTYELGPAAMAREYPALLDAGCNIVGACCGSNPEHIRLIAEVVRSRRT